MSVNLWSDMVIPWQLSRTIGSLLRDYAWQVLKHSQGGFNFCVHIYSSNISFIVEETFLLMEHIWPSKPK